MTERKPDITTDASYLALLKHIRDKLAAKVEAAPGDNEQAEQLNALARYIDEVEWK